MRTVPKLVLVGAAVLFTSSLWACYRQSVVAVSSTRSTEEAHDAFADNNSHRALRPAPDSMQGAASTFDSTGTKQAQTSLGLSREEMPQHDLPINATSTGKADQQEVPRSPPSAIQVIEQWRAQAEEYVKRLKITYPRDSDQYREAERRYIGVKVKFDAWLKRALQDLNADMSQSSRLKDAFDAAYSKYVVFTSYADRLLANTNTPIAGFHNPVDSQTLEKAAIRLWEDYNKGKQTRDLIEAHLRQLEWKDFDQIS